MLVMFGVSYIVVVVDEIKIFEDDIFEIIVVIGIVGGCIQIEFVVVVISIDDEVIQNFKFNFEVELFCLIFGIQVNGGNGLGGNVNIVVCGLLVVIGGLFFV